MAEESGEMGRRRSARIWALEEEKKKKKMMMMMKMKMKMKEAEEEVEHKAYAYKTVPSEFKSYAGVQHFQHAEQEEYEKHCLGLSRTTALPPTVKQYDRRRVKRKRLEDVVVTNSLAFPSQQIQRGENRKYESISDQRAIFSSLQQMPEKRGLEFVLDILQRRDIHEIFAQPVDPKEVEGYYEIINEPMDFGTMRAKLHEGMYTSLEQFKRDVYLITSNAMHFNASNTIYYREARAIQELAHRIFHTLKTDPENFDLESSLTKRRPGRKPHVESRGSRDGFEAEKRQTYRPRASFSSENEEALLSSLYTAPKPLFHVNQGDIGYKESLMQFAKDLGPTAQMVAKRKLAQCQQIEASHSQYQTPIPSAMTPNCLARGPSFMQAPANYLDGVNNGLMPQTQSILHDLPRDFNVNSYANKLLVDIPGYVSKENTHIVPNIQGGAYKGKMACIDTRMDFDSTNYLRDMIPPPSDTMGIRSNLQMENAYFNTTKDVKIASLGEIAANPRGTMDFCGPSSKGKTICTNEYMDFLHGNNFWYDTNPNQNQNQNQNQQSWLGSNFPFPGNENMNNGPAGNYGNTNMCNNYPNLDMTIGECSQVHNQVQPVQLSELQSRLLDLIARSNNYSDNTSFLTPQATKLLCHDITSLPSLGSQNQGGIQSLQVGPSLDWSRPTNQQSIYDFPNVQMQVNRDKPFDNGSMLHQPSHLVDAQKMALLHAMSFYERDAPESYQAAEASAHCLRDIQLQSTDTEMLDLDLDLQL